MAAGKAGKRSSVKTVTKKSKSKTNKSKATKSRAKAKAKAKSTSSSSNFVPSSSESSDSPYTNLVYNKAWGKEHNNCYAWAIDHFSPSTDEKLQPGDLSNPRGKAMSLKCSSLVSRVAADLGSRAYKVPAAGQCKPGYYKIFPFIAPDKDYHWYRSHKDLLYRVDAADPSTATSLAKRMGLKKSQFLVPDGGKLRAGEMIFVKNANLWSHKRGFATGPLLKDACGKFIRDPQKACRNYGGDYDYKEACTAFCVRK
jgi:hypothetical protein